ncbi:MAG: hypothetical protein HOY79_47335 [Streptomyces sp.]|nr:hypothetical protein [Streptomyces sp.]
MAIYARVEKVSETATEARYRFTNAEGVQRYMTLDKAADELRSDDGIEDHTYRAVAMKVGAAYARTGAAPAGLMVQS